MIRGDVRVDDKPEIVRDWKAVSPGGLALLWDAPYNRAWVGDGVTRVYDWRHALHEVIEHRLGPEALGACP